MQRSQYHPPPHEQAFSLVELSIVLVILGLLTGTVLTGQSLIRAAALRSLTRDFSSFMTATQTFRDKYFAFPGDMYNATQFWGSMNSPSDCTSGGAAATLTTGVCNGSGDGKIVATTFGGVAYRPTESYQYWRHLAKAGLIAGDYSGTWGTTGSGLALFGIALPITPLSGNSAYSINYNSMTPFSNWYTLDYGNFIAITAASAPLTPQEAWNIDTKIDDGKPAYGRIVSDGALDTCSSAVSGVSSVTNYNADYRVSDSTKQCSLFLRNL